MNTNILQTNKQRKVIAMDSYGQVKVVGVVHDVDEKLEVLHPDGRIFNHRIYFTRRDASPFIVYNRVRYYLNELIRTDSVWS